MTTRPTVEPAGVSRYFAPSLHNTEYAARCESGLMSSAPPEVVLASDHETAIARLATENKEMRQWWPSARLADLVTERDEARQQLAEMRGTLDTAATAFRTGFLPPEDWLARAHVLLGLPPTDQKCSQRESGDIRKLRRMLAFAYSEPGALYGDDGELCDSSCRPFIDYVRDSVDEIEQAIEVRGRAALAPASQPSRGKLSLSEAVEAARGHADPVRDLSAMRGDCAQPERQGQQTTRAPLFIEGVSDPSPPQDDIVAGLRDCLIRSKPEGDEAIVPIKLWERAIAALGEKGWIAVGEKLPTDAKAVLVWCPERQNRYAAFRQYDGWVHFSFAGGVLTEHVTHWMPMPAPPVAGGK